jgi:hypothetical protein
MFLYKMTCHHQCEHLMISVIVQVTRMVARDIGNAYDLLGVKPDVNPSVLKKRLVVSCFPVE